MSSKKGFTLFEVLLTLMLIGILASFALPKVQNYQRSACVKKLQSEILAFKLAFNHQKNNEIPINLESLYKVLDFVPSQCYFQKQKNGFIAINKDKKVYFVIKDNLLQCQANKSTRLANGESFCDSF